MNYKKIYVRVLQVEINKVIQEMKSLAKLSLDYNKEQRDYDFNIVDPDGNVFYTVRDTIPVDVPEGEDWQELYKEVRDQELTNLQVALVMM